MKRRFAIAMLLGCALTCVLASGSSAAGGKTPTPTLAFFEDAGRTIARDAFPWGSVLSVRAGLLDARCWRIVWRDPSGVVVRTDVLPGIAATRDIAFTLPATGPSGAWTAELQQGDQNPGGPDPCSATTSYTTRLIGRFDVARFVLMGAVETGGIGGDGGIEQQTPGTVPGGGVGPALSVRTERSKNKRAFIRFDLTGAGISGTVAVAKLRLFMSAAPAASRIYEVRRATGSWLESALNWNNRPVVNTGITDARSTGVTSGQSIYWLVGGDVAGFAGGTFTNYGWEIRDAAEDFSSGGREAKFVSTEASALDKTKWPVLLVDYDQAPSASAGGPYPTTCRTATVDGASAFDPEGQVLTYAWSSNNPNVTVSPAGGAIVAGSGTRPIPPVTATLSNSVAPAGQSATLTLTVGDGHGNTVTSTGAVTFNDDILPQITAPASRTVGTSSDGPGNCSTTVGLGQPVVSDNCTLPAGMVVTNDAPATFPTGQTTVTWTARDEAGNRSTATQTVTVDDDESPALSGTPSAFTIGTGPGATTATAAASWTAPSASDNCPGVTLTSNHAPGESFALGATTVTYTATDAAGHTTSRSFIVTVVDDTKPVLAVGADLTVPTDDGQCTALLAALGTSAADNAPGVSLSGVRSDGGAIGDPFAKGVTTIAWTATDAAGNSAGATQTVTVNDLEPPTLGGMPAALAIGTGPGATTPTAMASWTAPLAADNCPGVTLTSDHAPGESFPLGATTVTYTATDAAGHTASQSFTVTVTDDTPPVIALADLTVPTDDGQCAAHVASLGTSATDNAPGVTFSGVRSDGGAIGDPFAKGVTTIAWTATDAAGNSAGATQTVTVNDLEPPTLGGMPAALAIGTGPGATTPTAMASWTAPLAADNCPGVTLTSDHAPGESFPLGTTTVTYTATDAAGHTASQSFTVTVTDDTPPVIALADLTIPTDDGLCAALIASLGAAANDNAPGVTLVGVRGDGGALGDPFSAGTTPITWIATDAAGNTESAIQTVIVNDLEKPVIAAGASLSLATDAGLATAHVAGLGTSASDNCPGVTLVGARSDGGALGAPYPIGVTTVSWHATDANGNQSDAVQTVTVADRESPAIALAADVTVPNDDGQCAAHVAALGTTASDNAPGVALTAVRSDAGAIGDAFPGGLTTITWTATDASGNTTTAVQTVTVNDVEGPTLSGMPAALELGTGPDATGPNATVSWDAPLASDNCPGITLTSNHAPGESFALGVTTVTYTATDAAGHTASQSFTVTVTDDTEPVIAIGADLTVPTDGGQCAAAIAALGTSATDNAPGVSLVGIRGDGGALGDPFPAGATPIAWIATDAAGNTANAMQTVNVNDLEPPAIAPATGVSVAPDSGVTTARVALLGPAAGDNCPGVTLAGTRSDGIPLSQPYPSGVTTITWSATDASGNRSSSTQTVTVADRVRPVIALGGDLVVPTDAGQCAASVGALGTTASDNVPGVTLAGARSDGSALSAPYPAGATTITWTASDASGNTSTAVQTVNVNDAENPALNGMPEDVEVSTGPDATTANAQAGWTAPVASDNCPGVTLSSNHNPGETFPLGSTTVTYTATDAAGHTTSRSFAVRVVDDTPPTLAVADLTVPTDDDMCQATLASLGATASDNAPGVRLVAIRGDGAALGDPFQAGVTAISWMATDAAGNMSTTVQTVIVNDTEPPALMAPPAVHATTGVGATTASAIVTDPQLGFALASDNCSGARITRSGVPAGNRFPVGTTEIRYTATDENGNARTGTQLVTVVDDTPPVLAHPSDLARNSDPGSCDAAVTFSADASDNVPGVQVAFSPPSGSRFPVGASSVSCTATDAAGNQTSTSFTVTVTNPAPNPTITGPATGTLVPAGSPLGFTGSFTDNAGDAHTVQWLMDSFAVPGTVNEALGSVSATFAFPAAGVYLVQLPVTDGCGGSAMTAQIGALDEMVVVFDPSAEFVAGGGRFDSPPGALTSDPARAGDAAFGFVSRARRAPGGEFYFQLGSFRFHASSYDALTIGDGTALYHGTGTINGAGSYGFTLSAVDGQVFNDVDRFRLRITNGSGSVVYDNEPGAEVTAPAATELSAGAIEVQSGRLVASTRSFDAGAESAAGPGSALPAAFALPPNFPNPFENSTGLRFDLPVPSTVSLTVYDVLGREVASLVHEDLPAGRHQRTWNARGRGVPAGVYVVRMDATPLAGGPSFITKRKLVLLP